MPRIANFSYSSSLASGHRVLHGKGPGAPRLLVAKFIPNDTGMVKCNSLQGTLVSKWTAGKHFVSLAVDKREHCLNVCKLQCIPAQ